MEAHDAFIKYYNVSDITGNAHVILSVSVLDHTLHHKLFYTHDGSGAAGFTNVQ